MHASRSMSTIPSGRLIRAFTGQIATHGALWAYRYFEVGGWLGRVIANRYFYNAQEKQFRLGLLQSFAEGFRKVNRSVCIDTYTNSPPAVVGEST